MRPPTDLCYMFGLNDHPSQLRCLSLGCMHDKVTDQVMIDVVKRSPQIRVLDLTYCERITEEGFELFKKTSLRLLSLSKSRNSRPLLHQTSELINVADLITECLPPGFISIFLLLPALQDLNVRRCKRNLTDKVVIRYY